MKVKDELENTWSEKLLYQNELALITNFTRVRVNVKLGPIASSRARYIVATVSKPG